jgi:coenzyme F420-reducing hydrogenase delta subunit
MIELNDVDGPLQDIKYMAEVAAELSDNLDSNNSRAGFFEISTSEGNRLAFACNDILRRVEELIASISTHK